MLQEGVTTAPQHTEPAGSPVDVKTPNNVWAGNITNDWSGRRWAYLKMVLDLFSRKPVGWALTLSPDSELTKKALMMAYEHTESLRV